MNGMLTPVNSPTNFKTVVQPNMHEENGQDLCKSSSLTVRATLEL